MSAFPLIGFRNFLWCDCGPVNSLNWRHCNICKMSWRLIKSMMQNKQDALELFLCQPSARQKWALLESISTNHFFSRMVLQRLGIVPMYMIGKSACIIDCD